MEQPPHPTGVQSADCYVVDIELQPVKVVDDAESNNDDDGKNRCVLCTAPLEWVAIGRCGHRVVCRGCMVRMRFFYRNKRCIICRTRCYKVIVTKREASSTVLSTLPLFTFREGRVGKYWYHRHTAAYFEDEEEYEAARVACEGILSPFYQPWIWFIVWFLCWLMEGSIIGMALADQTKPRSTQVRAYAVGIFFPMLIGTIIWSCIKCTQDPLELEQIREQIRVLGTPY
ncbi:uncharacterized protein LOC133891377 [Phragmites australis]|uniref:uncharacterized protein LOC133891377 n=1 Tax=Phragmites australis TaxID=29695 RepID=UPI002D77F903|nr:uncharacterized protein LOC133891377 [Phragmites australis]XP_062188074.1 uncharacterized protein LOC133891377 [Phragmites australis]